MHRITILLVLALMLTSCATKLPKESYDDFALVLAGTKYCADTGAMTHTMFDEYAVVIYNRLNTYSYSYDELIKEYQYKYAQLSKQGYSGFDCDQMYQVASRDIAEHRASNYTTGNMMAVNQQMLLNLANQQPTQYNYQPMNLPTPNYSTGGSSQYYTVRGPNGTQRCTVLSSGIIQCF